MEKKNYCGLDILKFICSMLVVVLHLATYAFGDMAVNGAPPSGGENPVILFGLPGAYTLLRIAVPVFFLCSSFFLFKKIKETPQDKKSIIKNYCLRVIKLYLFWFVVFMPIMIDKYLVVPIQAGIPAGQAVLRLLWQVFLYAGYDGAWYLGASVISALLVYFLSKKLSNNKILIIAVVMYIIASLSGTYCNLFKGTFIYDVFMFLNTSVPLYHTFFNGTLFYVLGKIIAEKGFLFNKKLNVILLCCTPLVAYGELVLANYFALTFATDCFLILPLLALVIFQTFALLNLQEKKAYQIMRTSSTFTYFFHFIFLYILYRIASVCKWTVLYSNVWLTIVIFVAIILTSILLSQLVKKLSKKFKIFRYAL